jgi:multidrug resistance efflux pump
MRVNSFYLFIALFFTTMLFISIRYFRSAGYSSVGIAYAREYKINADRSAAVTNVWVVPGQQVKVGDKLISLSSFNLDLELDKLRTRIATLKSERSEKSKLAQAEIAYIKAEQGVEIEKLNVAIVQTESELELNKRLGGEFSGTNQSDQENPLKLKLEALKKQRAKHEEAIAIKINDILQETKTDEQLLDNQVMLLEREYELLLNGRKNLHKTATVDGVVENVFVKAGEQVDAYMALLSILPIHPTTVVGYQVGRKDIPEVGAQVMVRSLENSRPEVAGKVIGYGSVVPLPQILQKTTAATAFGREFFVEVPHENGFANGERVLIH